MQTHSQLRCLAFVFWALTVAPAVAQAEFTRHHRGTEIPLTLDASRVVIRVARALTRQALARIVGEAGVSADAADATGVPGWFFVNLTRPLQDLVAARGAVAKLAGHPSVEFASPAIFGLDGHWAAITPDILLQFGVETRDAAALAVAVTALGDATAAPFGGLDRGYAVRHGIKDGFVVLAAANRAARDPRVRFAEPDWQFSGSSHLTPNDPGWGSLWGMRNTGQFAGVAGMDMDADLGWDLTTGRATVGVLIIDTGVQQNHPDINQIGGVDLTGQGGGGGPVNSCDKHGTPVAGCVSAMINNNLGTVGTAPSCRSMSARTFISTSRCNGGWTSQGSWTVNALEQGRRRGMRVTNNSNGYGFWSAAIESKYAQTKLQGMVHFASAGNNASTSVTYPSSLSSVFAVAALASTGRLAGFSNHGKQIFISAPGANIYSTDRTGSQGYGNGDYRFVNGTSFASPYTAGIAALLISRRPSLTPRQIALALRCTRDLGTAGWDSIYGWGFVNANSALRCVPYGAGHPGRGGLVPELFAQGLLRINQTVTVRTERARGGATGLLVFGGQSATIPLLGGRLLVGPPYVFVPQSFSGAAGAVGAGKSALTIRIPNDVSLVGARGFLQSGVVDPSASQGLALTNGIELLIGP